MSVLIYGKEDLTLSTDCDNPLVRAVVISLFSWRRANPDDEIFDDNRQGYWADTYDTNGRKLGSRLWELLRNKVTEETLQRAKEFCEEALSWLIEDAIAESVDVTVERGELDRVDVSVVISQPNREKLSIRFQDVWSYLK